MVKLISFMKILLSVYDILGVIGRFFFLFEHVQYMYLCLLQCLQLVTKTCRCGQKQKEVLCSKQYLCETKCSAMRDCNKHQCKRKVCVHFIIVLYVQYIANYSITKMLLHLTIFPSFSFALRFENLILNVLKEILGIKKT